MSDLGAQIRAYYDDVVQRVDPTVRPSAEGRRTRPVTIAVAALLIALVVIGAAPFVLRIMRQPVADEPAPVPTTVAPIEPTTTTGAPADAAASAPGPTRVVLAGGTQIATIEGGAARPLSGYESLIDHVVDQLLTGPYPGLGSTAAERAAALGIGPEAGEPGLEVRLSLDPAIQEVAEAAIARWLSDPEMFIAVVVLDNATGRVLAAAPGQHASGGQTFDPARRLPAASLALVYTAVAAREAGVPMDSEWDASSPQTFTSQEWSGEWTIRNPGSSSGTQTLETALYLSTNTVFAAVGVELGADAIADAATRLGVALTDVESALPPPSIALGAGRMDVFDAATMFVTLSNAGDRLAPVLVESITDPTGRELYRSDVGREPAVDAAVVDDIREALSKVSSVGTGRRADLAPHLGRSVEQIGKTATSDDFTVAWYAGAADGYSVAVAVGRLDGGALVDVELNGHFYRRVFGGTAPAPMWAEIVAHLIDSD